MTNGTFTRTEIESQPAVWTQVLAAQSARQDELARQLEPTRNRPWLVTGCGSTYYLAQHVASLLRGIGVHADALPASELVYFPLENWPANAALLVISRSGTTTESLWAMQRYRAARPDGLIATITCMPETPMIQAADIVLLAEAAQEKSVAQTRSFSSMAVLAQAFAAAISGDRARFERLQRLPGLLEAALRRAGDLPARLGGDLSLDRFFYLGNGPMYGIACEAMLKTKEMTISWSEAYHVLEFRHGPMSVAAPSALVTALISDSAAAPEVAVLREMKALGARTLAICEQKGDLDWSGVDDVLELRSGLPEAERPALCLPFIQWLAYHRALAKGVDPDAPENLSQVIVLE